MIVCALKETRGEVSLARLVVQFAYLAAGVRRVFCAASVRLPAWHLKNITGSITQMSKFSDRFALAFTFPGVAPRDRPRSDRASPSAHEAFGSPG